MKILFFLSLLLPCLSFAQNQNEVDSLYYPCYSNGTSIMMFFHSDTSSKEKQFENHKADLLGYPSYNISKNDSTNNSIHIATHGFFIEDDNLFGVEKDVINPYFNIPPHIQSVLDSTENPFKRSGILLAKDHEPVLIDS